MENDLRAKIFSLAKMRDGLLDWRDYIDACLFDKNLGYYAKNKLRAGGDGADFYTSSSLSQNVFGELFLDALKNIFSAANKNFSDFEIVEIGAEPHSKIIGSSRAIRLGDEIKIPPCAAIISNELLDARPFSRFKFCGGKWLKAMLKFSDFNAAPIEVFTTPNDGEIATIKKYFPRAEVEGLRLDYSFDASEMLENICAQNWRGTIVFADYFRTAEEISRLPNGTARTYFKHSDGADFFENIGDTDITFSPCTEVLCDILQANGFKNIEFSTQEEFFVKRAADKIREIVETPNPLDKRKRELCQLLSPVHMGACFRILSATKL